MMWYIIIRDKFVDRYRSGHNGTDSKSCEVRGTLNRCNPHYYWGFVKIG